ncbi:flagellar export protein FliJ [Geobacter sp. DSM 9736]|uniref:flagellar export protein FliJ n=1 Tax=Geobacter sp. DSM 9736 TaxID=1277350 RepID=UPI000B4FD4EA|nr:flagellar export protein FliJ [Geobacter sp. DSM 9736]SNB47058.1 flagellar FliJ protein [Geobacter sp. DSM 9736]
MQKRGFELERILNFRQEIEKVRKLEFNAARNEYKRAEERLKREEEEADRLALEFTGKQSAGVLASELQLYANFSSKKSVDIKLQRHNLHCLDRNVTEKRETLLEAAKDKKVLEAFKDKKLTAHRQELSEKERAFLDEIAIQRNRAK